MLTRLRQIAFHPKLVDEAWGERSNKLQQLCETLLQLRDEVASILDGTHAAGSLSTQELIALLTQG